METKRSENFGIFLHLREFIQCHSSRFLFVYFISIFVPCMGSVSVFVRMGECPSLVSPPNDMLAMKAKNFMFIYSIVESGGFWTTVCHYWLHSNGFPIRRWLWLFSFWKEIVTFQGLYCLAAGSRTKILSNNWCIRGERWYGSLCGTFKGISFC